MIIKSESIAWANSTAAFANNVFNYISRYDNRLTHVTDSDTIDFDNKFQLKFSNNSRPNITIICNDENHTQYSVQNITGGNWGSFSSVPVFLIITENIFYFWVKYNNPSINCYAGFAWIIDDENNNFVKLVGDLGEEKINYTAIDDTHTNFYCVDDGLPTTYQISPIFKFTIEPNKLLFTDGSPFLSSGGIISFISNIISCSNVTLNKVVTLNGKNYYALGLNTLLEMDD